MTWRRAYGNFNILLEDRIVVPAIAGGGIAVIQDPAEIRGIIACLAGKGRGPPH